MQKSKYEHRFTKLTKKINDIDAGYVRATLVKVLFNPPLMLLILIFIVRLRD